VCFENSFYLVADKGSADITELREFGFPHKEVEEMAIYG
jgi:hypothetical protein